MKIRDLSIETKPAEEGEWFDHPNFGGVRICVRSNESEAVRKAQEAAAVELGIRDMEEGTAKDAATLKAIQWSYGSMLSGWEGIDDAPYSPELAEKWARTEEVSDGYRLDPLFFLGVRELSVKVGRSHQKGIERAAGNSPKESSKRSDSKGSRRATGNS